MGGTGALLLVFSEYALGEIAISILLTIPVAVVLVFAGMGGADAKALLAVAVLTPLTPHIHLGLDLPLWAAPLELPFPLIVFINTLLLFLVIPLGFLAMNMVRGDVELPAALLGFKMPAKNIGTSFVWPMEKVIEGKRVKTVLPQKEVNCAVFGDAVIWVTPKVPFLIPLTAGYAISFVFGDVLYGIISFFV
jgi:preflagellin peptidase FlaK